MTHSDSVHYLEQAGIQYKPAESPDLWTHLESRFMRPGVIGPKFAPMTASFVADLIAQGEEALLEAFVDLHRRSGALGRVATVLELPYIVGTGTAIPLARADAKRLLRLIEWPGTPKERLIHALPTAADEIPCTNRVTVTGGLYPDGHTAGYFDLCPGEAAIEGERAWLATREDILRLASIMESRIEDIAIMPRKDVEDMIAKARKV